VCLSAIVPGESGFGHRSRRKSSRQTPRRR
jgi:hypothetical protein